MMKRKTVQFLMVLPLLALVGCAPGPKFSGLQDVPSGRAELIVYRKSALFAAGDSMYVSLDDNRIGQLYNASFLQQPLLPGEHHVKVSPMLGSSAEKTIRISAGERQFLHFEFPTGLLANIFYFGDTLKLRDEKTALEDLKELSSAKPIAATGR